MPTKIFGEDRVPAENIEEFVEVYKRIKEQYVDVVDDEKLFDMAIQGMVSGLDPHSSFLSQDDFNELKIGTTGKFGGLGIEITTEDSFVKVISPIDDTPAQRVGIKSGDLIIDVGGTSLKDLPISDAVKLMRGEPGTSVEITVIRKEIKEPLKFNITREIIISKGVKSYLFDKKIGYVRLSNFQSNSTNDVKDAIYELNRESNNKMEGLIVDLRNNPGGVLGTAVGISDLFLTEGKIVYTKGRTYKSKLEYFASPQDIIDGLPLIVLINEGSASASEIVAGALQDHKRAMIMGTKSYGKASVQTIQELNDGSALKLTTARYYTPLGNDIHENGIKPDLVIEGGKKEKVNLPEPYDEDGQLFQAIKHLKDTKISNNN
jgi:carboxyl-terminal processing protease|tara:strand:- start:394 stop:1521 length:1128 start_codon:yes stop_codon:yes gene_type:complete